MRITRLITAGSIVACLSVSGCTPVLVGGAAVGGYYVGKDQRSTGRIVDDATITSSINAKYVKDRQISAVDINVDTYNGVVTLHGNVPSQRTADRAVALARATKGVKKVISRLVVVSSR
jgi:hyperosmotically inducible protein